MHDHDCYCLSCLLRAQGAHLVLRSGELETRDGELAQTLGDCEDAAWGSLKNWLESTASGVFQLAEMRHICVKWLDLLA